MPKLLRHQVSTAAGSCCREEINVLNFLIVVFIPMYIWQYVMPGLQLYCMFPPFLLTPLETILLIRSITKLENLELSVEHFVFNSPCLFYCVELIGINIQNF